MLPSRSFRSSLTGSAASAIATMAARATSAHDNTLHVDIALGTAQREVRSEEGLHFLTGRTLRAGQHAALLDRQWDDEDDVPRVR
mmetsp:Transcript_9542/g.43237  ORF Transcript_9542/g.43237 Transcript_9542/m.43237 type:complete len:85 (-) Transcript_9542:5108-5362(-)